MKTAALILATALSTTGGLAMAENHSMGAMMDETLKPLMEPMDRMMDRMPMESTGIPDADFLLMMIPHHQSAIEMAEVELETGTDEPTRKMAQKMIDAQSAEIEEMRTLLQDLGVEPPVID